MGARNAISKDTIHWTADDIRQRMNFALRCAYVHGISVVRTHLQSREGVADKTWSVFREVRERWMPRIALQGVSLLPIEDFATPYSVVIANMVADSGGVLGAVTRPTLGVQDGTMEDLDELLDIVFRLAAERALDLDLHVDESGHPGSAALPRIAEAALRHRFKGRVVCGHCCSLAVQPEETYRLTLKLCAEAGLAIVSMPMVNMYLQDRMRGRTPRWRGVTLVQEMRDAGIKVAVAGDNCRDPFFAYGDHDMLETLRDAVKVLHLDQPICDVPALAGPIPANIIRASNAASIGVNTVARLIVFNARTINELLCRPQSDRIVIDQGHRVFDRLPDYEELDLTNRL